MSKQRTQSDPRQEDTAGALGTSAGAESVATELNAVEQFESILTQFIEAGQAPILSQKSLSFLRQYRQAILNVITSPKQTPEQWLSDLLAPFGGEMASHLDQTKSETLHSLSQLWDQFGGFPGNIQQWLTLLASALDAVAPIDLNEWEEVARIIPYPETMIDASWAVISEMVARLQPSVDAGLVAIDLHAVAQQDFPKAVALCYYWITKYATLTEVAFPSTTDVETFAKLCDIKPPKPNSFEELNLAVWLQQHPAWSGMLQSLLGSGHPIAVVLRNGLKRPPSEFSYLVEIDGSGEFKRLRNLIPSEDNKSRLGAIEVNSKAVEPDNRVPTASKHYDSVNWFGKPYTFTVKQAAVVKVLWEAWEAGKPAVLAVDLLMAAESTGDRVRDIFKSGNVINPAWGEMIVKAGRSHLKLSPPETGEPH